MRGQGQLQTSRLRFTSALGPLESQSGSSQAKTDSPVDSVVGTAKGKEQAGTRRVCAEIRNVVVLYWDALAMSASCRSPSRAANRKGISLANVNMASHHLPIMFRVVCFDNSKKAKSHMAYTPTRKYRDHETGLPKTSHQIWTTSRH